MRGRQHRDHRRQRHGRQHTSPPAEHHQLPASSRDERIDSVSRWDVSCRNRCGGHRPPACNQARPAMAPATASTATAATASSPVAAARAARARNDLGWMLMTGDANRDSRIGVPHALLPPTAAPSLVSSFRSEGSHRRRAATWGSATNLPLARYLLLAASCRRLLVSERAGGVAPPGIGAVIPTRSNQRRRSGFDRAAYAERNRVGRCVNRSSSSAGSPPATPSAGATTWPWSSSPRRSSGMI
jgi:hypothetical protein